MFKDLKEKHYNWKRVAQDEVGEESSNPIMLPFGDHTKEFSFGICNVKPLEGFKWGWC